MKMRPLTLPLSTCASSAYPRWSTMIVNKDGACIIRGEIIGYTDPRRVDEIGEREIWMDGEVVGSFHNYEENPVGYDLAV